VDSLLLGDETPEDVEPRETIELAVVVDPRRVRLLPCP